MWCQRSIRIPGGVPPPQQVSTHTNIHINPLKSQSWSPAKPRSLVPGLISWCLCCVCVSCLGECAQHAGQQWVPTHLQRYTPPHTPYTLFRPVPYVPSLACPSLVVLCWLGDHQQQPQDWPPVSSSLPTSPTPRRSTSAYSPYMQQQAGTHHTTDTQDNR